MTKGQKVGQTSAKQSRTFRTCVDSVVVGPNTLVEDKQFISVVDTLDDKVIYIMRHGITEMNEWLYANQYNSNYTDPLLYDTRLSYSGVMGAKNMASITSRLDPQPQVIIASPLTRALQTAELAFADVDCPRVIEPLGREKVFHASDIGRPPHDYVFESLCDVWWYTGGSSDPKIVRSEPWGLFKERINAFKIYLSERPESVIAVVLHWAVIRELTGLEFQNCELRRVMMSDILEM
eukprot:TRINITY_DN27877_c0_g1_i1.p1 TRINITY_DN27877_c0_g1~~TRINITY_DN27877_c0_g1_i1.p1  ORF type:complete len:271 (-),score=0.93 TRINITY_DN27877_c0_g1_i1:671-1378(-)